MINDKCEERKEKPPNPHLKIGIIEAVVPAEAGTHLQKILSFDF